MSLLPLEGFVVGVTAGRRATEQAELLMRRGAEVLHAPTMSTEYLGHDDAVRRATEAVIAARPDILVATTGIGVRAWMESAQAWGLADPLVDALGSARVVARGPKAAAAVQVAGLSPTPTCDTERLDVLIPSLLAEGLTGHVVAVQHYGRRDERLVEELRAGGAEIIEIPVYRYGRPQDDGRVRSLLDAITRREVDAVTFTSAPAITRLLAATADADDRAAVLRAFNDGDVVAACVGPVCGEAARAAGIVHPVLPERGRLGLLVRVLTDALQARRREVALGTSSVVVQGRAVTVDGNPARLAASEAAVLEHLLRRPGAVVSKQTIARSLDFRTTTERAVEATVARLRRKLGPAGDAVRSLRGRGYYVVVVAAEPAAG